MFFRVMCWCKTPTKTTALPSPTINQQSTPPTKVHPPKETWSPWIVFLCQDGDDFLRMVDGWNPAHQLRLVSCSHLFMGFFIHPWWLARFLPSTVVCFAEHVMDHGNWISLRSWSRLVIRQSCRKTWAPHSRCRWVFLWHDKKNVNEW